MCNEYDVCCHFKRFTNFTVYVTAFSARCKKLGNFFTCCPKAFNLSQYLRRNICQQCSKKNHKTSKSWALHETEKELSQFTQFIQLTHTHSLLNSILTRRCFRCSAQSSASGWRQGTASGVPIAWLTTRVESSAYQQITCWLTGTPAWALLLRRRRDVVVAVVVVGVVTHGVWQHRKCERAANDESVRARGCRQLLVFPRWRWTRSGACEINIFIQQESATNLLGSFRQTEHLTRVRCIYDASPSQGAQGAKTRAWFSPVWQLSANSQKRHKYKFKSRASAGACSSANPLRYGRWLCLRFRFSWHLEATPSDARRRVGWAKKIQLFGFDFCWAAWARPSASSAS